jgi:uncharacterized protein YvpB
LVAIVHSVPKFSSQSNIQVLRRRNRSSAITSCIFAWILTSITVKRLVVYDRLVGKRKEVCKSSQKNYGK